MHVKTYQSEQTKLHVIGAKCGIHRNNTIVVTWKRLLTLNWCLDANAEWNLNPIDFDNLLEEENILWMLESPRLNRSGEVFVQSPTLFIVLSIHIAMS